MQRSELTRLLDCWLRDANATLRVYRISLGRGRLQGRFQCDVYLIGRAKIGVKIARKRGNVYPGFAHRETGMRDLARSALAVIAINSDLSSRRKFGGEGERRDEGLACGSAIKSPSFNRNKLTVR